MSSILDDIDYDGILDDIDQDGILDELKSLNYSGASGISEPIPPIPPGPIPCFMKGTKILTNKGYKLIETLEKGDNLINHKGEKIELLDVYSFKRYKNIETHPCLIKKGTIINGIKCNDDLYLSQDHSILINKYFVPVSKLVKPQKINDYKDYYCYYHIVTENFFTDVVISNSIPSETYSVKTKRTLGNQLFNNVLNNITKNDCRVLLDKNEFNHLISKISKTEKMKKMVLL